MVETLRRVRHEARDLLRRARAADVDDAHAVHEPGGGDFGAGVPSSSSTWNDANGTGRSSWVMSTTHRNAGGPSNWCITSSSATNRILRPPISNGTGIAECVGQGNGGDQSRPETNFGFDMSEMSMMT